MALKYFSIISVFFFFITSGITQTDGKKIHPPQPPTLDDEGIIGCFISVREEMPLFKGCYDPQRSYREI